MRTRACYSILIALIAMLHLSYGIALSQDVTPEDDFDVVVFPVAGSIAPDDADLSAETLPEMGLTLNFVFDEDFVPFPVPSDDRIIVTKDRIEIEFRKGEALQLFSRPITVNATPVLFTCDLTVSGAFPVQSAVAMIDIGDPQTIGVLLTQPGDLVADVVNEFSYSFEPVTNSIQLLLQFQGPAEENVSSRLVLERLRVAEGIASHELAVGDSHISQTVLFSPVPEGVGADMIETTPGGYLRVTQDDNRSPDPGQVDQALVLGTNTASDVIRTMIPVVDHPLDDDTFLSSTSVVAEIYLKRRSGASGIVSLALFSGQSGSTGVFEFPVSRIPTGGWLRIQSPLLLRRSSLGNPQVLLQMRGGPAEILADDLVLRAHHDSIHAWDSSQLPSLYPEEN